jgi:2-iminobutanoate/2-iminopropanoate deaminase
VKTARDPDAIHAPLAGYTHQIETRGGRVLFMSGQVGIQEAGTLPSDAAEQLAVALENVAQNVAAAGMETGDITKLTFYFVDEVDREQREAVLERALGTHRPCMTLVYVAALATPRFRVEVDAWAVADD